jgi:biotin-(acetyl-CoA carboxylase) ligase
MKYFKNLLQISHFQEFPLKIKWPNDIYFNRVCKIGGILVNASIKNNQLQCIIGKTHTNRRYTNKR